MDELRNLCVKIRVAENAALRRAKPLPDSECARSRCGTSGRRWPRSPTRLTCSCTQTKWAAGGRRRSAPAAVHQHRVRAPIGEIEDEADPQGLSAISRTLTPPLRIRSNVRARAWEGSTSLARYAIAGTLAYMAPEQTGRMNLSIEGCADEGMAARSGNGSPSHTPRDRTSSPSSQRISGACPDEVVTARASLTSSSAGRGSDRVRRSLTEIVIATKSP
jgi:hypothetical protein